MGGQARRGTDDDSGRQPFWLFYSGSLWGHKTYGIGIASCESVTGPCTKPLDHAWVSSDADGVSDQGPGGEEFYETGSIVWMVHHGLAPGQTGNSAQRRLYVDLVAFPPGKLPHLAARQPAAALAAAEIYYGDPSLPKDPKAAYLKVLHLAGVSATASDAALVAAGATACTDLAKKKGYEEIVAALEARHLSMYESYLAIILAAQYQCSSRIPEATAVMADALNQLPADELSMLPAPLCCCPNSLPNGGSRAVQWGYLGRHEGSGSERRAPARLRLRRGSSDSSSPGNRRTRARSPYQRTHEEGETTHEADEQPGRGRYRRNDPDAGGVDRPPSGILLRGLRRDSARLGGPERRAGLRSRRTVAPRNAGVQLRGKR